MFPFHVLEVIFDNRVTHSKHLKKRKKKKKRPANERWKEKERLEREEKRKEREEERFLDSLQAKENEELGLHWSLYKKIRLFFFIVSCLFRR
jgi:Flp pilus assembly protein TadB